MKLNQVLVPAQKTKALTGPKAKHKQEPRLFVSMLFSSADTFFPGENKQEVKQVFWNSGCIKDTMAEAGNKGSITYQTAGLKPAVGLPEIQAKTQGNKKSEGSTHHYPKAVQNRWQGPNRQIKTEVLAKCPEADDKGQFKPARSMPGWGPKLDNSQKVEITAEQAKSHYIKPGAKIMRASFPSKGSSLQDIPVKQGAESKEPKPQYFSHVPKAGQNETRAAGPKLAPGSKGVQVNAEQKLDIEDYRFKTKIVKEPVELTNEAGSPNMEIVNQPITLEELAPLIHKEVQLSQGNDSKQLKLELKPESLGKISIKLTLNQQKIDIIIKPQFQDTGDILNHSLNSLKGYLTGKGIEVGQIMVNVEHFNSFSQSQAYQSYIDPAMGKTNLNQAVQAAGLSVADPIDFSSWGQSSRYINMLI